MIPAAVPGELAPNSRRIGGHAGSQLHRPAIDGILVHRVPGEAELAGPVAVDLLTEQRHRGRGLAANQPRKDHEVAAAWMETGLEEAAEEPGILRDDPQVSRQQ